MMFFLQHNDPHHLHASPYYFYWFLVLAPILLIFMIYAGYKLMNYLDKRADCEQEELEKKKN